MKNFNVYGHALATVEVNMTVTASTEEEAMIKAEGIFKTGEHGLIEYSNDDASAIDFTAFNASELET